VDNNLFLSPVSLLDMSEGGAYAHNLFAGKIISRPEPSRETPYHPAHSTAVAGLATIKGGDNRFENNLFVGKGTSAGDPAEIRAKDPQWGGGYGLWVYDFREAPSVARGNIYYHGAMPYARESAPVVLADHDPAVKLTSRDGQWVVELHPGTGLNQAKTRPVTSASLGKAKVAGLPYVNADGSLLEVDTDYLGRKRASEHPTPGPFEDLGQGHQSWTVRD
jgi:hypothetical protein